MVEIYCVKKDEEMKYIDDIRMEVFAGEPGLSPELDMDGSDGDAIRVLAFVDGTPAGFAQMLLKGEDARIGCVAVRKRIRRYGIGTGLCKLLISIAKDKGVSRILITARLAAVDFFAALGFERQGEDFMESDLTYINMAKEI